MGGGVQGRPAPCSCFSSGNTLDAPLVDAPCAFRSLETLLAFFWYPGNGWIRRSRITTVGFDNRSLQWKYANKSPVEVVQAAFPKNCKLNKKLKGTNLIGGRADGPNDGKEISISLRVLVSAGHKHNSIRWEIAETMNPGPNKVVEPFLVASTQP